VRRASLADKGAFSVLAGGHGEMTLVFEPLGSGVRLTLQERTYQAIKDALLNGELTAGQSVTIREIAQTVGTSPTPVREAIRRLLSEGGFELLPNGTIRVRHMTEEQRQHSREVRTLLEGIAARRAALYAEADEVDALERVNEEFKAAIARSDVKRICQKNLEFHFRLYQAARSSILLEIIERLWVQNAPFLTLFVKELLERHSRRAIKLLTAHHDEMIAALRARDEAGAERALHQDLSQTFDAKPSELLVPPRRADGRRLKLQRKA
jgi:DNA-binding GntR family transcriptional regulator